MAATSNDRDLVVLLLVGSSLQPPRLDTYDDAHFTRTNAQAYGADPTLRDLDGFSALSEARRTRNDGMMEILNGAADIRAHFLATGRHEWPIVPDEEPEPEPAPLQRQETDYQPQLAPVGCFGYFASFVRVGCLACKWLLRTYVWECPSLCGRAHACSSASSASRSAASTFQRKTDDRTSRRRSGPLSSLHLQ
jgi:hypothetical protein